MLHNHCYPIHQIDSLRFPFRCLRKIHHPSNIDLFVKSFIKKVLVNDCRLAERNVKSKYTQNQIENDVSIDTYVLRYQTSHYVWFSCIQQNPIAYRPLALHFDPIHRRIYCPTCHHEESQYYLQKKTYTDITHTQLLLTHGMLYAIWISWHTTQQLTSYDFAKMTHTQYTYRRTNTNNALA